MSLFLHSLFEEQAKREPDSIAIKQESVQITYREVNQKAEWLAELLKQRGIVPGDVVSICLERSIDAIIALVKSQAFNVNVEAETH